MVGDYYVLVTGSAELSDHLVEFTRALGRRIMAESDLVLVTGGLQEIKKGIPTVDHEVVAEHWKDCASQREIRKNES